MAPKRRSPPASKIPPPALTNDHVTLSFKYFTERNPFILAAGGPTYPAALLYRLRDVCHMTADAMRSTGGRSLRCHQIDFSETSEPNGFDQLNEFLRSQIVPWQFAVSSNEHGRIHGFWIEDTFFVVWADPEHRLFPG